MKNLNKICGLIIVCLGISIFILNWVGYGDKFENTVIGLLALILGNIFFDKN